MQLEVGPELRRVREAKKLSLRNVASAVGVSASLLSQVETGKTQPSVSTLYALVNHLGISLDGLMGMGAAPQAAAGAERRGQTAGVVQRAAQNPLIEMENGVTWERLADGNTHIADPLIVTYAPGGSSSVEGKMMRHSALEYGCLLEGTLTLRIDFETYELHPGDSFCFDSRRPHLYHNASDRPARGIWFVIGRRDMGDQTLADLGLDDKASARTMNSAVDVLTAMRASRTDAV